MPKENFEVNANLDFENMVLTVKKGPANYTYQLTQVTRRQLSILRQKKIPSFILKYDGKLYWSLFSRDISFFSKPIFGTHLCNTGRITCQRLLTPRSKSGYCMKTYVEDARIENFPDITEGYETFGTRYDCFVVCKCNCFLLPKK